MVLKSHDTDDFAALVIVQEMNERGVEVLSPFGSKLGVEARSWLQYIAAATRGRAWTWSLVILVSVSYMDCKGFNLTYQNRVQ